MLLSVEPRESFDVAPGRYRATCIDVREIENKRRKGQKLLRIVWELKIVGTENIRYLVGKNYEPTLTKDSTLRDDICSWFGHDINARQFDTATLKNQDATVTIQLIENEGWEKAYRWVAQVEPPIPERVESACDDVAE
jgi:hypothetical protein